MDWMGGLDGWMNKCMNGWMDGLDEWVDGWVG